MLQGLGFEIAGGGPLENADRNRMARAINRFLSRVQGRDGIALIYYSGHGMRDRYNANYLIPTDVVIEQEPDVRAAGIALSGILDQLDNRPRNAVSLIVVDACRNNPFAVGTKGGKRGLGRVDPARGSLVLYSASPGEQADDNRAGRNGLFTKHLLARLDQPGLDIEDAFDAVSLAVERDSGGSQIPWSGGNLRGKVYLAGAPSGGSGGSTDDDLIAWQDAKRCGRPACYRAYLQDRPDGRFAAMAVAMAGASAPVIPAAPSQPVQPA